MRLLRLLAVGWLFHFKILTLSAFDGFLAILWPLFFATVACFMFGASGDSETLVHAALGAAGDGCLDCDERLAVSFVRYRAA